MAAPKLNGEAAIDFRHGHVLVACAQSLTAQLRARPPENVLADRIPLADVVHGRNLGEGGAPGHFVPKRPTRAR